VTSRAGPPRRSIDAERAQILRDAILVGFVVPMIMGVARWRFPRPATEDVRYQARLAEVAFTTRGAQPGVREA
jgi:hypothetical protein